MYVLIRAASYLSLLRWVRTLLPYKKITSKYLLKNVDNLKDFEKIIFRI